MADFDPTLYEKWWAALPDARLTGPKRRTVYGPLGPMEPAYCVNCGREQGCVTQAFVEHFLILCDLCFETHGHLPMPQVPPEIERAITQKED
jgi:hypothetical protein